MLIEDLIKLLQKEQKKHGNLRVFTNGDYGSNTPEIVTKNHVSCGMAQNKVYGCILFGLDDEDMVCYIGDY